MVKFLGRLAGTLLALTMTLLCGYVWYLSTGIETPGDVDITVCLVLTGLVFGGLTCYGIVSLVDY